MARYETTPEKAADLLGKIDQIAEWAALAEQAKSIKEAKRMLVEQSSGGISTAELRRMGHPFAKRAPQYQLNAAVINDQGGPFKKNWRVTAPASDGETVTSRVTNVDPKARFMHGTKKMIKRPIIEAVEARMKPIRRKRQRFYLNQEIDKEMKSNA